MPEKIIRPPGPENRGILGNMPLATKDPLGLYLRWARQYGDIFYYRALNRHVYFLNEPELIRSVLLTNYQNFVKGQVLQVSRTVFGNGLLTSEGQEWLRQRRLLQPAFHRERIESYGQTMVACTNRMLAGWEDGQQRDVHQDMMELALEIVTNALFRIDLGADKQPFRDALNAILELSAGVRMLLPPIVRMVPTPGNLRYKRAILELDRIVYGLIREHGEDKEGILAALLQARDADGQPMTEMQVRDEVMTLLLAGHETTAVSLSWIWYLLGRHTEVDARLVQELASVLDGRDPTVADLPALRYTEAVVKEAMRLYPPVWAVVRTPVRDCEIGGYTVPAGSNVAMSQWLVHRDPRFYPEPERFDPERWLGDQAAGLPKFAYFPFCGGPRSCIGSSFAMMEAVLVLAAVAQRYRLENKADCIHPRPSITLRPKEGVWVRLVRRMPERA